jgi:DNA-binding HxlR family transcriptional regulator
LIDLNFTGITFICKVVLFIKVKKTDIIMYHMPNKHIAGDQLSCPLALATQLLGDMWVLLIVKELLAGPKRYGQLETALDSHQPLGEISSRTLCQRLKMLEEAKIIHKKLYNEVPPRSEYRLTDKGQALSVIIDEIQTYGEKYLT